jgi:hypothetical protein
MTTKSLDTDVAKAISEAKAKEIAFHKEIVATHTKSPDVVEKLRPFFLNKPTCKHNSKARKDGLCATCGGNKAIVQFRWCDVKTCPKDHTCEHGGYYDADGSKIVYTRITAIKAVIKEVTKRILVQSESHPAIYEVRLLKTVKTEDNKWQTYPKGSWQYAYQDADGFLVLIGKNSGWQFLTSAIPDIDFEFYPWNVDPRSVKELAVARYKLPHPRPRSPRLVHIETKFKKEQSPVEIYLLKVLTEFGQMNYGDPRVEAFRGKMIMDTKIRSQLIEDGWKLYEQCKKPTVI